MVPNAATLKRRTLGARVRLARKRPWEESNDGSVVEIKNDKPKNREAAIGLARQVLASR